MLPHHDLDEAVAAAGGERIEARHGGALRHDAEQVARREAREAASRSGAARASRAAARSAGSRSGPAPRRRSRGARRASASRSRAGPAGGRASSSIPSAWPSARPQRAKSCGDWRSTVSKGRSSAQPFASAAPNDVLRKGAVGREAAVAEAEHGQGHRGWCGQPQARSRKPLAEAGAFAVAIGRREDDDAVGAGVARRCEGRHRRGVDLLPGRGQRGVQRRGEAPGAAALAADQHDRLGLAGGGIARMRGRPRRPASQTARRCRPSPARRAPSARAPARAPRRPGRYAACRSFRTRAPSRRDRPRPASAPVPWSM